MRSSRGRLAFQSGPCTNCIRLGRCFGFSPASHLQCGLDGALSESNAEVDWMIRELQAPAGFERSQEKFLRRRSGR